MSYFYSSKVNNSAISFVWQRGTSAVSEWRNAWMNRGETSSEIIEKDAVEYLVLRYAGGSALISWIREEKIFYASTNATNLSNEQLLASCDYESIESIGDPTTSTPPTTPEKPSTAPENPAPQTPPPTANTNNPAPQTTAPSPTANNTPKSTTGNQKGLSKTVEPETQIMTVTDDPATQAQAPPVDASGVPDATIALSNTKSDNTRTLSLLNLTLAIIIILIIAMLFVVYLYRRKYKNTNKP
jgi:hypothetical protein